LSGYLGWFAGRGWRGWALLLDAYYLFLCYYYYFI